MLYSFLLILIVIIFFFSSKTLSPIPYFPSQKVDMPLIIKALGLKNNQTIFDLGAGDGIVIFNAANEAFFKKLNTKFIAVEINPILIFVLHLRRLFHSNKKNIKIVYGDIFKMDFDVIARSKTTKQSRNQRLLRFARNDIVIYLYVSPWLIEKIIQNSKNKIKKFDVVSYMYRIKSLKNKETNIQGRNKIFIYK